MRRDFLPSVFARTSHKRLTTPCQAILGLNGASRAIGVDRARSAVTYASRNYFGSGVSYLAMDALSLAFREESFDLVVSFETMEHLADPIVFLKGMVRCLKKDGTLMLSVPNREALPVGVESFSPFH